MDKYYFITQASKKTRINLIKTLILAGVASMVLAWTFVYFLIYIIIWIKGI